MAETDIRWDSRGLKGQPWDSSWIHKDLQIAGGTTIINNIGDTYNNIEPSGGVYKTPDIID